MSKFKVDFSKFKHLKSDNSSHTLEHPDGHTITLQHERLSPEAQKQMLAMAKSSQTATQSREQAQVKMADGGQVLDSAVVDDDSEAVPQMFAEGGAPAALAPSQDDQIVSGDIGAISAATDKDVAEAPQKALQEQYNKEILKQRMETTMMSGAPFQMTGLDKQMFGNKGEAPENVSPEAVQNAQDVLTAKKAESDALVKTQAINDQKQNEARAALGLAPLPSLATQQLPKLESVAPELPQQATPMAAPAAQPKAEGPSQGITGDPEHDITSGLANQMGAIKGQAGVQSDLAKQQAAILTNKIQAQETAQKTYQDEYQKLEKERQDHMQDIKDGYIDPNKYWNNHSKLAAGIGMILAGFNPTSSPNAAIQMLQHQMDQNIQAQVKNLGAKENMLTANLRQFGNLRDATDMTRLMQNDIVTNQLQVAASKATSQGAKFAAQKAIGELQMQSAQILQPFMMRRAMMQLASNPGAQTPQAIEQMLAYMRTVNPEQAKEMSARYVPGYSGLSPVPVPEKARESLQSRAQLDSAAKDLLAFAKKNTGSLDPATIAQGKIKAQHLQSLYREGVLNTVYREGEQPLLDKIVGSDPTSFFNKMSNVPKLMEVIKGNDMGRNVLAKQYGLTPPQGEALPAEPVRGADGRMYVPQMHGGKQYMVPVKGK